VITKTDDYWHFYFWETCDDDPKQILALVEKCFAELREFPENSQVYVRCWPVIERENLFEGGRKAAVGFRASIAAPEPIEDEEPHLYGFGLSKESPNASS